MAPTLGGEPPPVQQGMGADELQALDAVALWLSDAFASGYVTSELAEALETLLPTVSFISIASRLGDACVSSEGVSAIATVSNLRRSGVACLSWQLDPLSTLALATMRSRTWMLEDRAISCYSDVISSAAAVNCDLFASFPIHTDDDWEDDYGCSGALVAGFKSGEAVPYKELLVLAILAQLCGRSLSAAEAVLLDDVTAASSADKDEDHDKACPTERGDASAGRRCGLPIPWRRRDDEGSAGGSSLSVSSDEDRRNPICTLTLDELAAYQRAAMQQLELVAGSGKIAQRAAAALASSSALGRGPQLPSSSTELASGGEGAGASCSAQEPSNNDSDVHKVEPASQLPSWCPMTLRFQHAPLERAFSATFCNNALMNRATLLLQLVVVGSIAASLATGGSHGLLPLMLLLLLAPLLLHLLAPQRYVQYREALAVMECAVLLADRCCGQLSADGAVFATYAEVLRLLAGGAILLLGSFLLRVRFAIQAPYQLAALAAVLALMSMRSDGGDWLQPGVATMASYAAVLWSTYVCEWNWRCAFLRDTAAVAAALADGEPAGAAGGGRTGCTPLQL